MALSLIVVSVLPLQARGLAGAELEALRECGQILDHWRDGGYGDLFEGAAVVGAPRLRGVATVEELSPFRAFYGF